ncbi:MFS transporter [soil metagenome]
MKAFKFWQTSTVLSLLIGYGGYYICRSNLSIATPLIIQEFGEEGINKEVMGQIASFGILFYAFGKVVNGILGDFIGGKKIFIAGMIGSVAATVFFGLGSGLFIFFAAWAANRLIQSMGWGGLVKITGNWFSFRSYGKIMGILSLSYLLGDIVAKIVLGQLLNWNFGWREIFFVAAGILAVIALIQIVSLKNDPESLGYNAPEVNPDNLFNKGDQSTKPPNIKELLGPYFKSFSFILLLLVSFGLTALREAFSFWIPTYLFEVAHLSEGVASQSSSLFSLFGMISIIGAGFISDVFCKGKRGIIITLACLPMAVIFYLMTFRFESEVLPLIYISLIGFFLLGPYSFLAGAMSLDLGGRKGAATAAGLLDAVGYAGGTISLWLIGMLAEQFGWSSAFFALTMISIGTGLAALMYYIIKETVPSKRLLFKKRYAEVKLS